MKKASQKRRFR